MGAAAIARIVLVLGLIVGVTSLMYSEMGIPGGPPSIDVASTPTFSNPFENPTQVQVSYTSRQEPARNGDPAFNTGVTENGCPGAQEWLCVKTLDNATLDFNGTMAVGMDLLPDFPNTVIVLQVDVDVSCSSTANATIVVKINPNSTGEFSQRLGTPNVTGVPPTNPISPVCGPSQSPHHFSVVNVPEVGPGNGDPRCDARACTDVIFWSNAGLAIFAYDTAQLDINSTGPVQVDYIRLSLSIISKPTSASCSSGNWLTDTGCQIGRVGDTIYKAFIFVANGLIFLGLWLVLIGAVAVQVLSVLTWLLTTPSFPAPVRVLIAAPLVAFSILILLEIAKLIRGSDA